MKSQLWAIVTIKEKGHKKSKQVIKRCNEGIWTLIKKQEIEQNHVMEGKAITLWPSVVLCAQKHTDTCAHNTHFGLTELALVKKKQ